MEKSTIVFIALLGLVTIAFLVHNYVFSIYETRFSVSARELYTDGISEITITATAVNAMGSPAWFRSPYTTFTIQQGADLVEVVKKDEKNGILVIRAKFAQGIVVVLAKPKYGLFPTKFEIPVVPNLV